MHTEYDFFIIEKEHLKGRNTFPFHLYIFNPSNKSYSIFLNGNRPLTKELSTFLDFILSRDGQIAILKKQRRTFLSAQEFKESEIPSLNVRNLHELEIERIMNFKIKEMYEAKHGIFSFQSEFESACEADNFEKIIEVAKIEILTFSVCYSPTVSLAIHLAKTHLIEDNFINRIVATSYFFAKNSNLSESETLADVICGAYLSHIGFTQLPLSILKEPRLKLGNKEKRLYEKHTILSSHLLKKSQINLSERCKKIILDHHERMHGGGYPSEKSGDSIEILALLVGSISHLFEYSSGKINGTKMPIKNILISIKNRSYSPGLEFDFGEKIFNSLVTLINTDKVEEKNIA